jgi:predicted nucleotidyltransferase component of viral defense system
MTPPKGDLPKNVAASVKARLLHRARSDGEDFNALVVRYVLERLLYRLVASPHGKGFVLKGALLFVVWSGKPHRATKDVDLLGSGTPDPRRLERVFREVCVAEVPDDGLAFLKDTITAAPIREDAIYDGVRLRLVAMLGGGRVPVQVDVGFGDATTPAPMVTELPALLEYPPPRILAYARESAIAEKVHAMVHLGLANSRMKDYYDLWFLSRFYAFEGPVLARALRDTFARRGTAVSGEEPVGLSAAFAQDEAKVTQWKAFVRRSRLAEEVPSFEVVVAEVRRFVMPAFSVASETGAFGGQWPAAGPWTPS